MVGRIAVSTAALSFFLATGSFGQFKALPHAVPHEGGTVATCATPAPDPATVSLVNDQIAATLREKSTNDFFLQIPVAVHLITSGKQGKFSRSVVDTLVHNLNVAYNGSGFGFYLVKLDYTNSKAWYSSCSLQSRNEKAMKKRLAYYPAQVLNLYSCNPAGPGVPPGNIGYAYFPWLFPETSYLQGAVVHPGTLPTGAGLPGYDYYGLNAVHEVGHWLGLLHVFQDGCADGDQVADTPGQAAPSFACDIGRDSCEAPGLDDIQNFMNYVDDRCYDHFSNGQAERMQGVVLTFRPRLFGS